MSLSVSEVNFGNAQNLISREGKYTAQQPKHADIIADKFEKTGKKKNTALKSVLWTVAGLAAVAAGLGWAVKGGKLAKIEGPEKILDHVKNFGYTIGDKVVKSYEYATAWCVNMFKRCSHKTAEAVE